VSKFANRLKPFTDYQTKVLAARGSRRRAVWATSGVQTYQALLDQFAGTEANLTFDGLYATDQAATGSSAGKQTAARNQVHLLADFRRAIRMKMAAGAAARSLSSLDVDRHDAVNRAVLISKVERLLTSPEINPQSIA
jgi:hypothetical protein